MDWDANVEAIIKHTDANLEQQFRQFADVEMNSSSNQHRSAVPSMYGFTQSDKPEATNFATNFLRETMASSARLPQVNPMPSSVHPVTFAEHFRQRHKQKRTYPVRQEKKFDVSQSKDNDSDWEKSGDSADPQARQSQSRPSNNDNVGTGVGYQVFTSPTYDMAQMMEQVRLSLKLEVDARAAIAERQLTALLALCKSTSDELDRLRIDVCANDRQIHTIDQIQAKLRQELTTQKDIGFHLQSMCGKDESWRMQADNQLLELRQMVATIREQGNGLQVQIQDKLSRQELLVQFNASIEPIKAQFQVTLQHQAQQLAEITRSSSSSTMLLDALTQKVNRMHSEEMVELRHELQALKVHVSRLGLGQSRDSKGNTKSNTKAERECEESSEGESDQDSSESEKLNIDKRRKSRRQKERYAQQQLRQDVSEYVQRQILLPWKQEMEKSQLASLNTLEREIASYKNEMNAMARHVQDYRSVCERNNTNTTTSINQHVEQQERFVAQIRDLRERHDQLTAQWTGQLEARITLSQQANERELGKSIEVEQRDRKQGLDQIYEEVRKTRHKLEEQVHELTCESRSRASSLVDEMQQKMRELDRKIVDVMEQRVKDTLQEFEGVVNQSRLAMERKVDALSSGPVKAIEEEIKEMRARGVGNIARGSEEKATTDESQKQQLASMESLIQQMMLQLKMHQQHLLQQPTIQPYSGAYWPPPLIVSPPPTPMAGGTAAPVVQGGHHVQATNTTSPTENHGTSHSTTVTPVTNSSNESTKLSTSSVPSCVNLKIDDIIAHAMTNEFRTESKSYVDKSDSRVNAREVPVDESVQPMSLPPPATSVASSAKGAMAEVEMAKQRVELRRKQELEARQQQQPTTPTLTQATTTPSHSLTRAASLTNLPVAVPSAPLCENIEANETGVHHRARSNSMSSASPSTVVAATPSQPNIECTSQTHPKSASPLPQSLQQSPQRPPPKSPLIPRPSVSSATELKLPTSPSPPPSLPPAPLPLSQAKSPEPGLSLSLAPPSTAPSTHVLCDQCRLPVRSDLLADHMQRQCIKRSIPCASCGTKYSWHEIDAHERECNNPTTDKTVTASPQLKKCRHCNTDVSSTEIFEHELHCDQMLKQCPHCLRRQKVSELQDHIDNCDCRLVPCPHDCGGKFLQRGIAKHLETRCPKRSPSTPGVGASATASTNPTSATTTSATTLTTSSSNTSGFTLPQEKLECKFCDEEFNATEMEDHETNCDWKPKRCQHCNMVVIARDLTRHEMSCKSTTKSCPHCHENLPQATLATHTSRCSKRPIKCIRCCQFFPADSIVTHSSTCKFVPTALANASTPPTAATPPVGSTPIKVPPPPPYPPSSVSSTPVGRPAPASSDVVTSSSSTSIPTRSNSMSTSTPLSTTAVDVTERLARRSLALSQLTNSPAPVVAPIVTTASRPSTASLVLGVPRPTATPTRPEQDEEEDHDIDSDEEEDAEEEDEDEEEHMSLAQVVAEWSVENVCLWLHEDVGVPEVVPRFQQRQCRGDMLLELTESDLINDYGVKNRIQRERILSAIDAIKTSDEYSDEDDDDDEEEDVQHVPTNSTPASTSTRTNPTLVRHNSQPSTSPALEMNSSSSLQSSSAMLRRINSALNVEFPSTSSASSLATRSTKR